MFSFEMSNESTGCWCLMARACAAFSSSRRGCQGQAASEGLRSLHPSSSLGWLGGRSEGIASPSWGFRGCPCPVSQIPVCWQLCTSAGASPPLQAHVHSADIIAHLWLTLLFIQCAVTITACLSCLGSPAAFGFVSGQLWRVAFCGEWSFRLPLGGWLCRPQLQCQCKKPEGWQPSCLQSLRCPPSAALSPATAIQPFPSHAGPHHCQTVIGSNWGLLRKGEGDSPNRKVPASK